MKNCFIKNFHIFLVKTRKKGKFSNQHIASWWRRKSYYENNIRKITKKKLFFKNERENLPIKHKLCQNNVCECEYIRGKCIIAKKKLKISANNNFFLCSIHSIHNIYNIMRGKTIKGIKSYEKAYFSLQYVSITQHTFIRVYVREVIVWKIKYYVIFPSHSLIQSLALTHTYFYFDYHWIFLDPNMHMPFIMWKFIW